MEAQEIFDKAYLGLMAQGQQSRLNTGPCAYHHNGLRCGVGMLIDDETAEKWDGLAEGGVDSSIRSVLDYYDTVAPDWVGKHINLLEAIQGAHDYLYDTSKQRDTATPEIFRDRLTDSFQVIAIRFALTIPEYTDGN